VLLIADLIIDIFPFDNVADFPTFFTKCTVYCDIDTFRGETVTEIRMAGLDHALLFTAVEGKVYIRSYRYYVKNFIQLL